MVSLDNAEIMVDLAFAHEPDAIVMISENKNPIAIMAKDEWESGKFNHVKDKCRQYEAPAFFGRHEIPVIGVSIYINLETKKPILRH